MPALLLVGGGGEFFTFLLVILEFPFCCRLLLPLECRVGTSICKGVELPPRLIRIIPHPMEALIDLSEYIYVGVTIGSLLGILCM